MMRRRRAGDEGGFAMIAAIGVLAIALIASIAITSSVISAQGQTSLAKASVQSQASADAGIADARVAVSTNTCSNGGHFWTSNEPVYDVQIYYKSGSSWVAGCPPTSATDIKIVSNGDADDTGVAGVSAGDSAEVEAKYTAPVVTNTVTTTGQAVYTYGSFAATQGGHVSTNVTNVSSNVYVKNGSLNCDGGAGIGGSVVVPNGDVTIGGSCKIGGSIYASGTVTMNAGGSVGVAGDIVGSTVKITNSGAVQGSVWATGSGGVIVQNATPISGGVYSAGGVRITNSSAKITGNVIAAGALDINNIVSGSVRSGTTTSISNGTIFGNVYSAGNYTQTGGTVSGFVTTGGTASLTGGTLGGAIYATGAITNKITLSGDVVATGGFTFSGGSVGGSIWATGGNVTATWGQNIGGSLIAKTATLSGGNVSAKVYISDTLTVSAYYGTSPSGWTNHLGGSNTAQASGVTKNWNGTNPTAPSAPATPAITSGPAAPAVPSVPNVGSWIDWTFRTADWSGFTVVTLSGTSCNTQAFIGALATIGSNKGVIDARSCGSVDLSAGYNAAPNNTYYPSGFTVKNDLAIITTKFTITSTSAVFTSPSTHSLWLLQEDTTPDQQPTCGSKSFNIGDKPTFTNLNVMVYTPCTATINMSNPLNGQIYAATTSVQGAGALGFTAVGIPGYDLDTGTVSTPSTANRTWTENSRTSSAGD